MSINVKQHLPEEEGVIKYTSVYSESSPPERSEIRELLTYRILCFEKAWVAALPDGTGYGNMSLRSNSADIEFWVTGSQTGHLPYLTSNHIAIVNKFDILANTVWCSGPLQASSESLTHAGIYKSQPEVQCVIHIHSKALWEFALNRYPTTDLEIPYGTPELSLAIMHEMHKMPNPKCGLIALGGHEDGLIAWGTHFPEVMDMYAQLEAELQANNV